MANHNVKNIKQVTLAADTNDHTITIQPNSDKREFTVNLFSAAGTIDVQLNEVTDAESPTYITPNLNLLVKRGDVIHVRGAVGSEVINVSVSA